MYIYSYMFEDQELWTKPGPRRFAGIKKVPLYSTFIFSIITQLFIPTVFYIIITCNVCNSFAYSYCSARSYCILACVCGEIRKKEKGLCEQVKSK